MAEFSGVDRRPLLAEVKKTVPSVECVNYVDVVIGGESFQHLIVAGNAEETFPNESSVQPGDGSLIIYTSGSTGKQKAALLTHKSILAMAWGLRQAMRVTQEDRVINVLPLDHVGGATILGITMLSCFATLVLADSFRPDEFIAMASREKVTVIGGVPTMFAMVLNSGILDTYTLSGLRLVAYGGASATSQVLKAIKEKFGCQVMGCYGLTEVSGFCTTTDPEDAMDAVLSTVGRPIQGSSGMLSQAEDFAKKYLPERVAKGKLSQDIADRTLVNLKFTPSLEEAVSEADYVIEAAVEKLDVKRKLFADLDRMAPAQAILATNSSFIVSSKVADATKRPDKVCNMHFFNPVLVMKLVEVVQGPHTSGETAQVTVDLAEKMGKNPVWLKKEIYGFLVNRILAALNNQAVFLADIGIATPEEIDIAVTQALGHPMGPFRLMDLTGIDLVYDIGMERYQSSAYKGVPFPNVELVSGKKQMAAGGFDHTILYLDSRQFQCQNGLGVWPREPSGGGVAWKLARRLADGPTRILGMTKIMLNKSLNSDLPDFLEMEASYHALSGGTEDFDEGVRAFTEKRKPEFKGR